MDPLVDLLVLLAVLLVVDLSVDLLAGLQVVLQDLTSHISLKSYKYSKTRFTYLPWLWVVEHSEEALVQKDLLLVDRLSEGRQVEDQLLLYSEH